MPWRCTKRLTVSESHRIHVKTIVQYTAICPELHIVPGKPVTPTEQISSKQQASFNLQPTNIHLIPNFAFAFCTHFHQRVSQIVWPSSLVKLASTFCSPVINIVDLMSYRTSTQTQARKIQWQPEESNHHWSVKGSSPRLCLNSSRQWFTSLNSAD